MSDGAFCLNKLSWHDLPPVGKAPKGQSRDVETMDSPAKNATQVTFTALTFAQLGIHICIKSPNTKLRSHVDVPMRFCVF